MNINLTLKSVSESQETGRIDIEIDWNGSVHSYYFTDLAAMQSQVQSPVITVEQAVLMALTAILAKEGEVTVELLEAYIDELLQFDDTPLTINLPGGVKARLRWQVELL